MTSAPSFNPAADFARSPWTPDQVASLNAYQQSGVMHPFTCGDTECRRVCSEPLAARGDGWYCMRCGYTQDWAHAWMADWSWRAPVSRLGSFTSGGHDGPGTGLGTMNLPIEPPR